MSKPIVQNLRRGLREGEFSPDQMKKVQAPPPPVNSKYDILYKKLKQDSSSWYTVGWSASKRSADTTASRLRRNWGNTIVMARPSDSTNGGYDIIAVYLSTRKTLNDLLEYYNLQGTDS